MNPDERVEMENTKATTVEIMGRAYRVRGAADEKYVQEVARYVDDKVREVSQGSSLPASDRVAILAAMNIADELFQLRRASHEELSTIERKTESLISLLDEKMSVDG
ncbi:MAG: cell division protein ZapA [Candidatus Latescibacteria bacterium]|nr:cell division protein ZapA [Candidatus Latescibacterota bacterium]